MYKKMFSSSLLSYTGKNFFATPCHQLITKTHKKFGLLIKYFSIGIENYDDDDNDNSNSYKTIAAFNNIIKKLEGNDTSLTSLELSGFMLNEHQLELLSLKLKNTKCRIKFLDLRHNNINKQNVQFIVDGLKGQDKFNAIEHIDLRFNKLEDVGLRKLSSAILNSQSLKVLNLWDNKLTDDGMKSFSNALSNNNSLENISLGFNTITNDGVQLICNAILKNKTSKLKELNLRSNYISCDGAKYIGEILHRLDSITISNNNIEDTGAWHLASILVNLDVKQEREDGKPIAKIDLSKNEISNDGLNCFIEGLQHQNAPDNIIVEHLKLLKCDSINTECVMGIWTNKDDINLKSEDPYGWEAR